MKRPIGIFDSGVGGLTVYKAIRECFPNEDLIYFGDTARVPYGPKSKETIIEYSVQNARFLLQHNVKIIIVACNTSSAAAIHHLSKITSIPVMGVIEPGAQQAVESSSNHRIGVIGTEGTVRSGAYSRAIHQLAPITQVFSLACPLFVPLAEEGWLDHPVTKAIAAEYLGFFKDKDIDTLVLGCTHYPLLAPVIQEVMGESTRLVDSAQAITTHLRTLLTDEEDTQVGTNSFFVSDNEQKFSSIASRILGYEITQLKRVRMFESWFAEE